MSKHRYFDGNGKSSHPHGTHGNDVLNGSKRNDRIDGGRGDDVLNGRAGNDILHGNSGKDVLLGGSGNDILYGDDKSGHGGPFSWLWSCKPAGYVDYLDGGSGSDKVYGGGGNDFANYTMAENLRAHDVYDGGRGADTLQLKLTYGEFALDSVKQDIARYEAFLASHSNPLKDNGAIFHFNSFNLGASDFEKLKVDLVNAGPTAKNDAGTTNEDTVLTVSKTAGVLANDIDPDHLDVLHVTGFSHTSALGAAVVVNADGSYSYDPTGVQALQALAQGASITDSFTYTVADLAGATSSATVKIKVTGLNDGLVARDDAYTATEDSALTVPAAGVLGNDTAGTPLHAVLVSGPAHGSLTLSDNGSFVYTPNADFNGSDSFSYRANDGSANSATALVSISVAAVNDAPVAADENASVTEDSSGNMIQVLANDKTGPVNEAGQTLTVTAAAAEHGAVAINADGTLSYTPNADFFGTDTINYTVKDNGTTAGVPDPLTATASVHVNVTEINDKPIAADDSAIVTEGSNGTVIGVLGNDRAGPANESGQTLAVTAAAALHGAVAINADGTLSYTPNADFFGADTISYTVKDNGTTAGAPDPLTASASVHVNVTEINDAPTALGDTAVVDEDNTATIAVLANDTAGPNEAEQTLTVIAAEAGHGAVTINADGTLSYTPDADFFGSDTINYTVKDNGTTNGADDAKSASATVEITVKPVNDIPFAADDSAVTDEDTPVTGNVLTNDGDVDNDTLTVTTTGTFASEFGAAVTLNADGTFTYDPTGSAVLQALDAGASKVDSFSYSISDGQDNSSATVKITVDGLAEQSGGSGKILDSVAPGTELDYYVRFGDSSEWLELDSFNVSQFNNFGGASLTLGSSNEMVDLTRALLSGSLTDVEIEAYLPDAGKGGQLVDEFKFNDVSIDMLNSGNGIENTVQFGYGSFTHGHIEQDAQGGTQHSETGWDYVSQTPVIAPPAPHADLGAPLAAQVPTSADLDYYVHFDGMAGWLELDSFSMGLAGANSGGTSSAQSVWMELGSSSQILALTDALNGNTPLNIEIESYAAGGGKGSQLVDEFKFNNVSLNTLDSSNATHNNIAFDYTSFTHGHVEQDSKGGTHNSVTGWDFSTGTEIASPTQPHADATTPVSSVAPGTELDYYVRFGDSSEWLELDSFNVSQFNNFGGASLTLGSSNEMVDLTRALLSGSLTDVEIEAYLPDAGKGGQLVDEFKFNDVSIDMLNSGNGIENTVQFGYGSFTHGHIEQDAQGGTQHSETGWDYVSQTPVIAPPAPHADLGAPLAAQVPTSADLDYYVHFDGMAGWLELDSFSMGLAGANSGGTSSAQSVWMELGSSSQILALTDALNGNTPLNIEIESYAAGGGKGSQLVDEFKFNNVSLNTLDSSNATHNNIAFDYTSFTHGHVEQDSKGGTHNSVTGWDFSTGTEIASPTQPHADATTPVSSVAPGTELDYYVRFGDSSEWLELDSFNVSQFNNFGGASLTLGSSNEMVDLTRALLSGSLTDVEIEAYLPDAGKGGQLVDEFKFNDVSIDMLNSGNGIENTVQFGYGSFTHGHIEQDAQGGTQHSETGWDYVSQTPVIAPPAPHADLGAPLAAQVPTSADLDYYVHFDGMAGWLELDSFSMGLAGANSGGTSSAQSVWMELGSSSQILALTDALNGNTPLNIEIESYAAGGGKGSQLVDEFKFNNVSLNTLDSSNATHNNIAFDYTSFTHGHVEQDSKGGTHNSVTGWDFSTGTEIASPAQPHADVDLFA